MRPARTTALLALTTLAVPAAAHAAKKPTARAGQRVVVQRSKGSVSTVAKGTTRRAKLTAARTLAIGSRIDASKGTVKLTVQTGRTTFTATLGGGAFTLGQPGKGSPLTVSLTGGGRCAARKLKVTAPAKLVVKGCWATGQASKARATFTVTDGASETTVANATKSTPVVFKSQADTVTLKPGASATGTATGLKKAPTPANPGVTPTPGGTPQPSPPGPVTPGPALYGGPKGTFFSHNTGDQSNFQATVLNGPSLQVLGGFFTVPATCHFTSGPDQTPQTGGTVPVRAFTIDAPLLASWSSHTTYDSGPGAGRVTHDQTVTGSFGEGPSLSGRITITRLTNDVPHQDGMGNQIFDPRLCEASVDYVPDSPFAFSPTP